LNKSQNAGTAHDQPRCIPRFPNPRSQSLPSKCISEWQTRILFRSFRPAPLSAPFFSVPFALSRSSRHGTALARGRHLGHVWISNCRSSSFLVNPIADSRHVDSPCFGVDRSIELSFLLTCPYFVVISRSYDGFKWVQKARFLSDQFAPKEK
jgi:hypothetical protein